MIKMGSYLLKIGAFFSYMPPDLFFLRARNKMFGQRSVIRHRAENNG